jgi:hypothetical protein
VAKILHCGKNKITESVPVHGFGVGPNAQLKEQAAQIQKVSAQLEASKSAPQVVNNP